jgi:hypothetical protein
MSKIPSGEWSAIAARHAKGESLSAIARSYGCTPPAIHYVLKRNERQAVENGELPVAAQHAPAPPSECPSQAPPGSRRNGEIRLATKRRRSRPDAGGNGSGEQAASAGSRATASPRLYSSAWSPISL